jgi:hypothetical protein
VDELFSLVLVGGNLLLADVVNEGLSLVHVDHHDLLISCSGTGLVVVGAGSEMDGV